MSLSAWTFIPIQERFTVIESPAQSESRSVSWWKNSGVFFFTLPSVKAANFTPEHICNSEHIGRDNKIWSSYGAKAKGHFSTIS